MVCCGVLCCAVLVQGLVMIRRLKADVVKHLPAKHREVSMFNLIGGRPVLPGPAEGEAAQAPAAGEGRPQLRPGQRPGAAATQVSADT